MTGGSLDSKTLQYIALEGFYSFHRFECLKLFNVFHLYKKFNYSYIHTEESAMIANNGAGLDVGARE